MIKVRVGSGGSSQNGPVQRAGRGYADQKRTLQQGKLCKPSTGAQWAITAGVTGVMYKRYAETGKVRHTCLGNGWRVIGRNVARSPCPAYTDFPGGACPGHQHGDARLPGVVHGRGPRAQEEGQPMTPINNASLKQTRRPFRRRPLYIYPLYKPVLSAAPDHI
jgi:hypothetical protein